MTRRELDAGGPVIVGAGLAGLSCAIEFAPAHCLVLSAGETSAGTSTGWAQGGLAAAVGADDSPALHAADTMAAGAGLCDEATVAAITAAAPDAVDWLAGQGVRWDRHPDGSVKLGLEGAHQRRRIVHAGGDGTGAELLRAVVERARTLRSITLWEHARATRIVVEDGRVTGVEADTPAGAVLLRTPAVVLATGGVGGLFSHTTNPLGSRGQGLALAFRAGAVLRDLELVQFHPTALDVALDPMPLVSEAVRGEGAILVDESGERVLADPLAARDVVSRATWARLRAGHRVFLDARRAPGATFAELFPSIAATARAAGLDPARDLLPVRPAAHYHMGGVLVDADGRSTVSGLFAAGEVASTGLHGANRLASNSLLEAVVCGRRVARTLAVGRPAGPTPRRPGPIDRPAGPVAPDRRGDGLRWIRDTVSEGVGVLRDGEGLRRTLAALGDLAVAGGEATTPTTRDDAALVGYLIALTALQRTESRGGHTRTDFPGTDTAPAHTLLSQASLERASATPAGVPA